MTDEEYERIKEAEKDHLRTKKELRETLDALKRRGEVQSVVRRMNESATRLLRTTESAADAVASAAARQATRLEMALDEETVTDEELHEADEALREEHAEALVRRYKQELNAAGARARREAPGTSTDAEESGAEGPTDGPDKTIGRMRDARSSDDPT